MDNLIALLSRIASLMPSLLVVPIVYLIGWLTVQPLRIFSNIFSTDSISLFGTIISFIVFIFLLPSWSQMRWGTKTVFRAIGVTNNNTKATIRFFWRGIIWAFVLLFILLFSAFLCSSLVWIGDVNLALISNALLLCLGVGFAEELIFRGWLWEELNNIISPKLGIYVQALIFSIVHIRFDQGYISMILLLIGLFLLGLLLAIRRKLDGGSLWGCIGFHGGLVGGWFLVGNGGLIQLASNTPGWIVGPGDIESNPIAGLLAITILLVKLFYYRKALLIDTLP